MYEVGAQASVTTIYYRDWSHSGACTSGGPPGSGETFFAAGTDVTNQLVAITLSPPLGSGALAVRYLQSADGLQIPSALHDTSSDADCSPFVYYGATATTCRPQASGTAMYSDGTCTMREFQVPRAFGPPKAFAISTSMCPLDPATYYKPGSVMASPSAFNRVGGICQNFGVDSNSDYYSLGAQITLPPLTRRAADTPGHRLESVDLISGNTLLTDVPDGDRLGHALYDTTLGTECDAQALPDGTLVCMPRMSSAGGITGYFSDPGCTTPIDLLQMDGALANCSSVPVSAYAIKQVLGSSGMTPELHRVGAAYQAIVFSGTPSSCYPAYPDPNRYMYYSIGDVVPLSSLATATLQVDP